MTPRAVQVLPQCLQPPPGCPPGAEPRAWAGSRVGVLVLHGFTGSPWEVAPVADAAIAAGCSVAMPVLAGHATAPGALQETTWQDWLHSAEKALAWLDARCDRVHLVGLSMGALLALLLVRRRAPQRQGEVVLLAPALYLPGWLRPAVGVLSRLGWPDAVGKQDPGLAGGIRPPCYGAVPLRALHSLYALQNLVLSWPQPRRVLVLHGSADPTIPCQPALRRARRLLGPDAELRVIPEAGHLLPRTDAAARVVRETLAWLGLA